MSNSENEPPHEEEYNEEEEQNMNDINLSGNNLTDVTELLSKLENEDQILSLDLSNNQLTFLPEDLSHLVNLNTLNLSKNHFSDYTALAKALSTLPQLVNLYVDLENNEDALTILEALPNIQYLNGMNTREEEEVEEEENEEEEKNLYSNNVNSEHNNQTEEIQEHENETSENNNITEENRQSQVMENPKSFEKDNNVIMTSNENLNEEHLEQINGDLAQDEIKEDSLENEIPNFNNILQKVSQYYKNAKDKRDKFYLDFQEFLKKQIDHINSLIDASVPNYIYSISVHQSKIEIYSYLRKKIFPLFQTQKLIQNTTLLVSALSDIENYSSQSSQQIYEIVTKLNPKIDSCINSLKETIKSKNDMIAELKNQIKQSEAQKEKEIKAKNADITKLTQDNKNLSFTNSKLKSENESLTNRLISKAKNIIHTENTKTQMLTSENVPVQTNPNNLYIKTITNQSDLSTPISPFKPKVISKKQLLEIINEIYKSKELSDKKNTLNQLPKETMEQHMYNYLKSKYGLKNLIIEWATSIINGIKMYSKDDGEVCLFGKLLRNEIEENTIIVVRKMKDALTDLIKFLLGEKYPNKSYDDINSMCAIIKSNRIYMEEDVWKSISALLFQNSKHDMDTFIVKVEDFIKERINSEADYETLNSKGRIRKVEKIIMSEARSEMKILYKDFFQLLLEYQIKLRSNYLRNFVSLFREVDIDYNGVINDEQFKELIKKCNLYPDEESFESNYERLIETVDNYGNNIITFSDVVAIFDRELVENGITALEKIAIGK